jgi:hypothetical protein
MTREGHKALNMFDGTPDKTPYDQSPMLGNG